MTSSLTSQYTYLCMNICSALGYFQPGVFQIQGHAKLRDLQQHFVRSKYAYFFSCGQIDGAWTVV